MLQMLMNYRNAARAAVVGGVLAACAGAASAQDYSGWWWNPNESGRGVNIAQNGDVLEAALFVYDESGSPFWATFVGTLANNAASGALLSFIGPPMGPAFDPAQVRSTQIGTARFVFDGDNSAAISYDAGGFTGPAAVERFAIGAPPLDGRFKTIQETVEHCDPREVGDTVMSIANLQTRGSRLTISLVDETPMESNVCQLDGDFTQLGNRVAADGTLSCTSRTSGGAISEQVDGTWSTADLAVSNEWVHANIDAAFELGTLLCDSKLRISGLRSDLIQANR